jgi:hypothetical protein
MLDFLTRRNSTWHFVRRVPSEFAKLDPLGVIKHSTKVRVAHDRTGRRAARVARQGALGATFTDIDIAGCTTIAIAGVATGLGPRRPQCATDQDRQLRPEPFRGRVRGCSQGELSRKRSPTRLRGCSIGPVSCARAARSTPPSTSGNSCRARWPGQRSRCRSPTPVATGRRV